MAAENPTHHLIFYLDGITGFLGNFYPTSIHYNKMDFQCAEAAYQSRKFDNFPEIQQQFCAINGNEAFRLAQRFKEHIPKN